MKENEGSPEDYPDLPTPEVHTSLLEIQAWARKLENRIAELEYKIAELEFAMDAMENIHQSKRVHSLYLETD